MSRVNFDQLLEAGVHFGHLKRKWNPAMAPYIFMERNGIHIIDLYKTVAKVDEAAEVMKKESIFCVRPAPNQAHERGAVCTGGLFSACSMKWVTACLHR